MNARLVLKTVASMPYKYVNDNEIRPLCVRKEMPQKTLKQAWQNKQNARTVELVTVFSHNIMDSLAAHRNALEALLKRLRAF